ncbi:MAG: ArsR family transcriptional regulator [Nanoarchaeota archaeon]
MATKRRFSTLRLLILKGLKTGQKTVNQLAGDVGINWRTVDNHIVHLVGRGLVAPVFVSPYVKIYQITDAGRVTLEQEDVS